MNFYAGIGSRQTPTHILKIMHHMGAYLFNQGWTLRSGGANGADKAFEQGVDDQLATTMTNGQARPRDKEIYLPWAGFNHSTSKLHPENYPFSEAERKAAAMFHPAWDKCSPLARLMHTRNVRQVLGCEQIHGEKIQPSKFLVCWTDRGLPMGGTAQALRIAQAFQIPIFNLGKPTNPDELEAMVLEIDKIQNQIKEQST